MRKLNSHLPGHLAVLFALYLPLASSAADRLYWGNEGSGKIRAANLDGSGTPSDLFSDELGPCGIAIDPASGKIYWAPFHFDGIRVANLDGSGAASTLFADQGSLCGVAIDPLAGKIYWANFTTSAIRVGNLDGSGVPSTLFQEAPGSAPSGVAIDPAAGKIYWANQFSDEIRVGSLDGSGTASTLVSGEDNPIGVVVDPAAGKVYWAQLGICCAGPGTIRVANLDGTGISTLFSGEFAPAGVAIDPAANRIYWADNGTASIRVGGLDGTGASNLYSGEITAVFPAILKAPVPVGDPSISGEAMLGLELTCQSEWAPDMPGGFLFEAPRFIEYQWIKDGVDIPDAAQTTFTPTVVGLYSCRVTASNEAGSTTRTSNTREVTAHSCPLIATADEADYDADGIADICDNCLYYANADQSDTDRDGRGDACECTDQNGDGKNTVSDLVAINTAIFNPALATPLCDGNNDGLCNVNDILAANVEIFSPTNTSTCARQPVPGP